MRVTDRQTDRILIAIPRLHHMQRGKKLMKLFFSDILLTFAHRCSPAITALMLYLGAEEQSSAKRQPIRDVYGGGLRVANPQTHKLSLKRSQISSSNAA